MKVSKYVTDRRIIISTVWIFIVLNYAYADILILLSGHSASTPEEAELVNSLSGPEFMMVSAIYLEMAMVLAVLSRVLSYRINRWANIIVATLHIIGGLASLFVVTNAIFYIFFVSVEMIALFFIVWYSWTWVKPQNG